MFFPEHIVGLAKTEMYGENVSDMIHDALLEENLPYMAEHYLLLGHERNGCCLVCQAIITGVYTGNSHSINVEFYDYLTRQKVLQAGFRTGT